MALLRPHATGAPCRGRPGGALPLLPVLVVLLVVAVPARGAVAQVVGIPTDAAAVPVDSSDVLARARREQARFEIRRARLLPATWGGGRGSCEERVGRFCFWFDDEGREVPPEPREVARARDALVAYLDSVQVLLPGEGWIVGQRVWYRAEGGRWSEALATAEDCGAASWWCDALRGFALHGVGRSLDAEEAFARALDAMPPERAARWTDLRVLLPSDARQALAEWGPGGEAFLWRLADPLLLAPGNDRLTEHYARWTAATLKEDARNPFGIPWGRDMEELTVRMGWEVGWERVAATGVALETQVVGHHAPDAREFLPGAEGLRAPERATPEALQPEGRRPRTLYAPRVAPAVVTLRGQVAVFPRGEEMVVVATHYLPPDTLQARRRPRREALRASVAAPGLDTLPQRAGLFLIPARGGAVRAVEEVGVPEGALALTAPAGAWVVAVETWAPDQRRAGRSRLALAQDTVPRDVVAVSDLLLVRDSAGQGGTLADVVAEALPRPVWTPGEPLAVAWEVTGLGWSPTRIRYELTVRRARVGLVRRLGEWVGVVDRDRPLALSWNEAGPARPGPVLRVVGLELGEAEEGEYEVVLRAHVPGRGVLTARASLTVVGPEVDD